MSHPDTKQHLLAETKFGLDFLKKISDGKSESLVFSPLSVSLALALVHSGAHGVSKIEIEKCLLGGVENEHFVEHFSNLAKSLKSAANGTEVNVANRVYVRDSVQINPNYLSLVSKNYDAGAESLDFLNPESAVKINKFISETTRGKLDNLVSSDSISDAVALLINAVYFKGKWQQEFDLDNTGPREFTMESGDVKEIPFLTEREVDRGYSSDEIFEVLTLNYKDANFKFAIFLPKVHNGLKEALKKLDFGRFQGLLESSKWAYMNIEIPKFSVEKELSLKETLTTLGISEIFSDQADLSGIAENTKISDGTHKALIEVNEEGTTAAAATVV